MFAFNASKSITDETVWVDGKATVKFISVLPVFSVNVLPALEKILLDKARTSADVVGTKDDGP
jgi:hypothetical protein